MAEDLGRPEHRPRLGRGLAALLGATPGGGRRADRAGRPQGADRVPEAQSAQSAQALRRRRARRTRRVDQGARRHPADPGARRSAGRGRLRDRRRRAALARRPARRAARRADRPDRGRRPRGARDRHHRERPARRPQRARGGGGLRPARRRLRLFSRRRRAGGRQEPQSHRQHLAADQSAGSYQGAARRRQDLGGPRAGAARRRQPGRDRRPDRLGRPDRARHRAARRERRQDAARRRRSRPRSTPTRSPFRTSSAWRSGRKSPSATPARAETSASPSAISSSSTISAGASASRRRRSAAGCLSAALVSPRSTTRLKPSRPGRPRTPAPRAPGSPESRRCPASRALSRSSPECWADAAAIDSEVQRSAALASARRASGGSRTNRVWHAASKRLSRLHLEAQPMQQRQPRYQTGDQRIGVAAVAEVAHGANRPPAEGRRPAPDRSGRRAATGAASETIARTSASSMRRLSPGEKKELGDLGPAGLPVGAEFARSAPPGRRARSSARRCEFRCRSAGRAPSARPHSIRSTRRSAPSRTPSAARAPSSVAPP